MKKFIFLLISFFAISLSFAKETPIKGLNDYKLDNGLEVFVAEDHKVPLVYIEIAVRCGAYTQTEKTAGLFHLYEHMMFKGNSTYATAAEFNKGLKELGVTSHNGTTNLEWVNYFFTIPKEQLKNGLNFWSEAIRNPLMEKNEFEREKKVVISEILEDYSEPTSLLFKSMNKALFPSAPWKRSPGGTVKAVQNATVKQLKEIQKKYYVPNNSALFIGGDVNPDEAFEVAKQIFGDWKKAPDPFVKKNKSELVNFPKNPLKNTKYIVFPFDKISPEMTEISVTFRGPDAEYDLKDTYTADMLTDCIDNPENYFKTYFTEQCQLGIEDKNYVSGGYTTNRTCGEISFSATILSDKGNIPDRAKEFTEKLYSALKETAREQNSESLGLVNNRFRDSMIFNSETSEGLLTNLRYWWAVSTPEYFYNYIENMKKVTAEDMEAYVEKYIKNLNPYVVVLINPELYEKCKADFIDKGFTELDLEDAKK